MFKLAIYALRYDSLALAVVVAASYALALLTSHVCAKWIIRGKIKAEMNAPARYETIDGIRGFLAFGVFIHHFIIDWVAARYGLRGSPPHNFENELGKGSVAVFFMITAFLFWGRAYAKRGIEIKKFFTSRLFRIYPIYVVFISLLFLATAYESKWKAMQPARVLASEATKWAFFHMVKLNGYPGELFGGVAWTLLYEAWFYLALPLLVFIVFKKASLWKKLAALLSAALLFKVNHLIIGVAAAFLGGVAAVYWGRDPRYVALARGKAATVVAVLCLACVGLFVYDPFNLVGIALLSGFFIIVSSGNSLFGLLKLPAARWMGEISYSIYLLHGVVLWLTMDVLLPRVPGFHPSMLWLSGAAMAMTPLIVALTSASYLLIERPFIAMGHRVWTSGNGRTSFAIRCGNWLRGRFGGLAAVVPRQQAATFDRHLDAEKTET